MTISASEVKELRKMSGAGMMECKSALSEANGDIEIAFKILREKGIAKAEKKSSRDANEGLIGVKIQEDIAVIVEINTETDFVSRNSEFHKLMNDVLSVAIDNPDNLEKTREESKELINQAVGKIGENIVLKKIEIMKGRIFSYVHNSVANNLGKIGVLISLDPYNKDLDNVGKNLCMHIAASSPKAILTSELDKDLINSETEIIKQQLKDTGKPDDIIEKMLNGKLNKFFEEVVLMNQKFVIDPSMTVKDYLISVSSKLGHEISVKKYIKYEIGS
tara:strand:- start:50 stop:877 length:828 start_codon:yes stop_codon:yes gene_type:complete